MHRTVTASPRRRHRHPKRPVRWVLALSLLAASLPAATITVDDESSGDIDDALCTLREAIVAANQDLPYHGCSGGLGADQIEFELAPGTTIEGSVVGLPTIVSSITLVGPGADQLTIDGGDLQPLFLVDSPVGGAALQVQDLTLARGNAFTIAFNRGGAATFRAGEIGVFRRVVFRDNRSDFGGGALVLLGQVGTPALVTIEDCLFEFNEGGLVGGGAIFADHSVLDIRRSTFAANETDAEPVNGEAWGGGAIHSRDGVLTIRASTFSANASRGAAGAILVSSIEPETPDTLLLSDSTIFGNAGDTDADDLGNVGGVAISAFPGHAITVEFQNNLIAGNVDSGAVSLPDVYVSGAGITSHGFNLIGRNPNMAFWFPAGLPNANGDYVGTDAQPAIPQISPLADWGGPTPVHLPLLVPGNLALDRGDCYSDGWDQRGYGNPQTGLRAVDDPLFPNGPDSDGCDIGAAEAGAAEFFDLPFADGFEDGTTGRWTSSVEN